MEDVRRGAWWMLLDSTTNLRTINWVDIAYAAEVSRTPLYRRWSDPAEAFVDAYLWHAGTSEEHLDIEDPWRSARLSLASVGRRWNQENMLFAATRLLPLMHRSPYARAAWEQRVNAPVAQDIRRCFVLSRTRAEFPHPERAAEAANALAALPFRWLSHLTARLASERWARPRGLDPAHEIKDYAEFIDREVAQARRREVGDD